MFRQREPTYNDKRLTTWLRGYYSLEDRAEITNAVRQLGSHAIPKLLNMIARAEEPRSPGLSKFDLWWFRHITSQSRNLSWFPQWIAYPPWLIGPAERQKDGVSALLGFRILEAKGQPAIPDLATIFESSSSPQVRDLACSALVAVDPTGHRVIPVFMRNATNSDENVRFLAVFGLSQVHCPPRLLVPILVSCLESSNLLYRTSVLRQLGENGPEAKDATPHIIALLNNPEQSVRAFASEALKRIDPEAAAKAGVR
jgi:HEAT repeat protein